VLVAGEETGEGLSTWRRAAAAHQSSESETAGERETETESTVKEGGMRRTAACSAQDSARAFSEAPSRRPLFFTQFFLYNFFFLSISPFLFSIFLYFIYLFISSGTVPMASTNCCSFNILLEFFFYVCSDSFGADWRSEVHEHEPVCWLVLVLV